MTMFPLEPARKLGRKYQAPIPTTLGGLRMMLRVLPLYLKNREQRTPLVTPGPFKTDTEIFLQPPSSGLRVTWFGHSSLLLEVDGVTVLVDPVWDERASPLPFAGPKRFFAPTLPLEELPPIDAVLLSHDHYDHLGKRTVRSLARLRPGLRWIVPLEVGRILTRFGVATERITELDWTRETVVTGPGGDELKVTSVPSRHFSGRAPWNRNQTLWQAFVLKGARHCLLHGADSGIWPGYEALAARYGPFDLTLLEIGAFNEQWKHIHLGPDGAIEAFKQSGGGMFMPVHWGLFDLALHGWTQPIERVLELAREQGILLFSPTPGEPTEPTPGAGFVSGWYTQG